MDKETTCFSALPINSIKHNRTDKIMPAKKNEQEDANYLPQRSIAIFRPLFAACLYSASFLIEPLGPPVFVFASYVPASCHLNKSHKKQDKDIPGTRTKVIGAGFCREEYWQWNYQQQS